MNEGSSRTPVTVLLGGPSAEHDVSAVSGWAIADALEREAFEVDRLFIDLAGQWWQMPAAASNGRPKPGAFDRPAEAGATGPWTPSAAIERLAERTPRPTVFVALHGPFGEDGTVQALLESADLAYTGAGVAASALGMEKAIFKRLVRGLGLPVVDWIDVPATRWTADRDVVLAELERFAAESGDERLMVKPVRLGSSVGMTIAHGPQEREAALDEAFRFDTDAIVERYLDHPRELEVAVVGNGADELEAFGPGEIFPGREFYDYVAKYSDGVSETVPLADLDPALAGRIRSAALEAYRSIGCEGFARVDFMLTRDDPPAVYLNEINTIPGFTPISLFPLMAALGYGTFGAVCRRIVELAERRHSLRVRRQLTTADLPR